MGLSDWAPWEASREELLTDRQREELDLFGAQCREAMERARNRPPWPPDGYEDSSDTTDGYSTPTGLLTPAPEQRWTARPPTARLPPRTPPHLLYGVASPVPSRNTSVERAARREAERATELAIMREERLRRAESGPVDWRPVVGLQDNATRYRMTPGMHHDLWGTRHATRSENRRQPYLFALNSVGKTAVVTVGDDDSTCKLFHPIEVSLGLTPLSGTVGLYDPEVIAIEKWMESRHAQHLTSSNIGYSDEARERDTRQDNKRREGFAHFKDQPVAKSSYPRRLKRRESQNVIGGKEYRRQKVVKQGRGSRHRAREVGFRKLRKIIDTKY